MSMRKVNYHYEECVFATSKLDTPVYTELCRNLAWTEIDDEDDLRRTNLSKN